MKEDLNEQKGGRNRTNRGSLPHGPEKEQHLSVEAAELVFCDPQDSAVLCDTYIFDPDEPEKNLGSLYITLETINQSAKASEVLSSVATAIRKEYYSLPDREIPESLEAALQQANYVLKELVNEGESDWSENFHAAVAVFHDKWLHISKAGGAALLMFRKNNMADIGKSVGDSKRKRPLHAFTSVASGNVTEEDQTVLATSQLLHILPENKLKELLAAEDPSETVSSIKSLLEDARENTAFASIFLKFVKAPARLPVPDYHSQPRPLPPSAKQEIAAYKMRRPDAVPNKEPASPPIHPVRPRRPIDTKPSLAKNSARIAQRIAVFSWQFLKTKALPLLAQGVRANSLKVRGASEKISERIKRKKENNDFIGNNYQQSNTEMTPQPNTRSSEKIKFSAFKQTISSLKERTSNYFRTLPRSAKIFLTLTVILALLFGGSLYALSKKQEKDQEIKEAAEKLQEAQVKKEGANSALIYENFDNARKLIKEAKSSANEVKNSGYYEERAGKLLADLTEIQDRVEKVTRIKEPQTVGDFSSYDPNLSPPSIAVIKNSIFTFNPENNTVYRLSNENGEIKTVSQTSQGIGYLRTAYPLPAENMILFSTDSPGLAMYDTERDELLKQEITLPEEINKINALSTYGNRLYIFSPQNNEIYSFAKTISGYDNASPWLKDKSLPLSKVTSMGIDGYIYLLTSEGEIIKLLKGAPVEFEQAELTTPLENPSRLVIDEQLKHIYVLDPPNKRVVVYDTVGNLTDQYVFPNSNNLKDITVKGNEEILFVLDKSKVYRIPLSQKEQEKQ